MAAENSTVDVAVVGAGSAGLAAAKTLARRGVGFVLLEASHRIGGRAYTEQAAPGEPFDLGCHWLHSASLNPYVKIAESLGVRYDKSGIARAVFIDGRRAAPEVEQEAREHFVRNSALIEALPKDGPDRSVAEVTERDGPWTAMFDYYMSLYISVDTDQVSALDVAAYRDTDENWPVIDGYGTLIARFGADVPVRLNAAVRRLDWSGREVRLETPGGTVTARKVILTVSTGILGAGDIRFDPPLPDWKREAVAGLPLGNHNRICLVFDRDVFGPDAPEGGIVLGGEGEPMHFRVRPFGYNYVPAMTGGRFADWLERAGTEASADFAKEKLKQVFGNDITRHIVRHIVTAWRGDPWVRGAYSVALPGQSHQRAELARPIDGRLYFAGEATSREFFSTAHGAYLSGIAAAEAVADSLGAKAS